MELVTIIQGDTKDISITLDDVGNRVVREVWFSSKLLGLKSSCSYNGVTKSWDLSIDSNLTATFPAGKFYYDITVIFDNNKVLTTVYKGSGQVLEKENKIV